MKLITGYWWALACSWLWCFSGVQAQSIAVDRGPFVGGVGPDSARLYVRTNQPTVFEVQYATDSLFANPQVLTDSTQASHDNSRVVALKNLLPNTYYYYRVLIGGQIAGPAISRFRTFPPVGGTSPEGVVRLAFGSCQQKGGRVNPNTGKNNGPTPEDSIFLPIIQRNPHVFVHLGDWAYPNTDIANADTVIPYTRTRALIAEAYRVRYAKDSFPSQDRLMRSVPFDYVWDDCDYIDGGSGALFVATKFGNPDPPITVPVPAYNQTYIRQAYQRYFPHYRLVDTTQGIYHSFRLGNLEVFVLDLRHNMTPFYAPFVYGANGRFTFQEPVDHTILGQKQKQWLFNGLKNSTADWKIIVSSLTFHKGYDGLLDLAISLQGLTAGSVDATNLAYKLVEGWPGYRKERQEVLDFVSANAIKGVVVISGDSHTSAIDDGRNGGLPELMSANLTVENGKFLQNFPDLWNRCAQKVNGVPDSETFGLIEAFGADSLRMVLVDKNNRELCAHTLKTSSTNRGPALADLGFSVYPNPARNQLTVVLPEAFNHYPSEVSLWDATGRNMLTRALPVGSGSHKLDIAGLPRGIMVIRLTSAGGSVSRLVLLD